MLPMTLIKILFHSVKVLLSFMLSHYQVSAPLPSLIASNQTCVYHLFHVNMAAVKKVYEVDDVMLAAGNRASSCRNEEQPTSSGKIASFILVCSIFPF